MWMVLDLQTKTIFTESGDYLTHFKPMIHFFTTQKQKTLVFWYFKGVSEWNIDLKWVNQIHAIVSLLYP